ncbi:MAG: FoF1 ATP synthase subunit gamma [Lachnospiraceae bacterium]
MSETNLLDIKKRVNAARQTRKITSTMELIASSRLYRGKSMLSHYSRWAAHVRETAGCLPDSCFMVPDTPTVPTKKAFILFGGSEGLSGAYGTNLFSYTLPLTHGHDVIAVGSATTSVYPTPLYYFDDEIPSVATAGKITKIAADLYNRQNVQAVSILYTQGYEQVTKQLSPPVRPQSSNEMVILEPPKEDLCKTILTEYLESLVYEAHLQAFVAEQIARVSAMDHATQNADQIISELQSRYNRIRQSAITQEIIMFGNSIRGGNESIWEIKE